MSVGEGRGSSQMARNPFCCSMAKIASFYFFAVLFLMPAARHVDLFDGFSRSFYGYFFNFTISDIFIRVIVK